jgi:hypothetical protein
LLQAVQDWGDDNGDDPYFAVRRAGVLAETGRLAEADRACTRALDEIRRSRARDVDDIPSLSREAWGLILFLNLRAAISFSIPGGVGGEAFNALQNECRRRWRELANLVGDPWDELTDLKDRLDKLTNVSTANGYVGIQGDGLSSNQARRPRYEPLPAEHWSDHLIPLQALRIADDSGLPAQVANVTITRDLRIEAVRHLRPVAPTIATVAFLRVGRMKEGINEKDLFDPVWVARLDQRDPVRVY